MALRILKLVGVILLGFMLTAKLKPCAADVPPDMVISGLSVQGNIAFSPNGAWLALSGYGLRNDTPARTTFYKVKTWKEYRPARVQAFEAVCNNAKVLAWSVDSKRAFVGLEMGPFTGAFMVVSVPSFDVEEAWHSPDQDMDGDYTSLAAPLGASLVVGAAMGDILRFRSYKTGKTVFKISMPGNDPMLLAASPDGDKVTVAGKATLVLINAKTREIVRTYPLPGNADGLAYDPATGQVGAAYSDDTNLYGAGANTEWFRCFGGDDLSTTVSPKIIPCGDMDFKCLRFSRDGRRLFLLYNQYPRDPSDNEVDYSPGKAKSFVFVKDMKTFKKVGTLGPVMYEANSMDVSPDGKYLVTSTNKALNIWLLDKHKLDK